MLRVRQDHQTLIPLLSLIFSLYLPFFAAFQTHTATCKKKHRRRSPEVFPFWATVAWQHGISAEVDLHPVWT